MRLFEEVEKVIVECGGVTLGIVDTNRQRHCYRHEIGSGMHRAGTINNYQSILVLCIPSGIDSKSFLIANLVIEEEVDDFYIFPSFFLEQLQLNNAKIYKIFEEKQIDDYLEDCQFFDDIHKIIETYIEDVKLMELKSNIISNWNEFLDDLNFYQYLMTSKDLRNKIISIDYKHMREIDKLVKNKQIKKQDALEEFNLKENDFIEYLDKQDLDYMR